MIMNTFKIALSFVFCLFLISVGHAEGPTPPDKPQGGPYFHWIASATSLDGKNWSYDNNRLIEHASVPATILTRDGKIRMYYVDASSVPETTNCAESKDGGKSFTVLGCKIEGLPSQKALDPSIVILPDGRYRLYFYSAEGRPNTQTPHTIASAISEDGIRFIYEGEVFQYQGLVDPDVFWSGREWVMLVFSLGQGTIMSTSKDGRNFRYIGPFPYQNWGTTAPHQLSDGSLRLFAFNQPDANRLVGFVTTDGVSWKKGEELLLKAPAGTQLTDPFAVHFPDGNWKMFFKLSETARERRDHLPPG